MGANAQTAVPTFTAGQVLTAAQMNESARTGVPVFATTGTRDAAFGGTGEKTLAEGQMCYVESTGFQTYNGSSWVTWGTAPSSGLAVVKADTAFSAASSITADGVFTSTYRYYTVKIEGVASVATTMTFKLRVSATSASTNYNCQSLQASSTTVSSVRTTSQTSAELGTMPVVQSAITFNLYNPAVAVATNYDSMSNQATGGVLTGPLLLAFSGNHSTATAYDGIEIISTGGTITGSYAIYGWGK